MVGPRHHQCDGDGGDGDGGKPETRSADPSPKLSFEPKAMTGQLAMLGHQGGVQVGGGGSPAGVLLQTLVDGSFELTRKLGVERDR